MDDDLMSFFHNYLDTETEEKNDSSVSTDYGTYSNPDSYYKDDYSVKQNYKEQTNYQSDVGNYDSPYETQAKPAVSVKKEMFAPTIEKQQEQTYVLTKSKQKIVLSPRLKMAICVFAMIMISILSLAIYNIVSVSKVNELSYQKQVQVESLLKDINELENEYNVLVNDKIISNENFSKISESNTQVIYLDDFYEEKTDFDVPSNWFDSLCEFLSNLFN